MATTIIITLSILILLAYIFDITGSITKIPSVILLLVLGFLVKQIALSVNFQLPNLNPVLPILGTVGLILIVLEGSLELEINKSKLPLIGNSSLVAFLPILLLSFAVAYFLHYQYQVALKTALASSIPLAIISSAIAIPSAKNLLPHQREFVTYETSLSDIFGVIFFNFITLNDNIGGSTFGSFFVELLLMLAISFAATVLLAVLLNKIKHHTKFIPVIILVILIYALSKVFHLPALIFILLFGLTIGNIDELKRFTFIGKLNLAHFKTEIHKFKEITTELAFLTRALFFILFGFIISIDDITNSNTIVFAACITIGIFLLRFIMLKLFKIPIQPLIFIAPRGLITILLFLSIPLAQQTAYINKSLVTQVIILSALVMMFGLMAYKKPAEEQPA